MPAPAYIGSGYDAPEFLFFEATFKIYVQRRSVITHKLLIVRVRARKIANSTCI